MRKNKNSKRIQKPQRFSVSKKGSKKTKVKSENHEVIVKEARLHNPNFKQSFFRSHPEMPEVVDATIYFIRRDYSHLSLNEQKDLVMEELNNACNYNVPKGVIFPE